MTPRREQGSVIGLGSLVAVACLLFIALWLAILSESEKRLYDFAIESSTNALVYATAGALILRRDRKNAIGWLFCGGGLASALQMLSGQYAVYAMGVGASSGATSAWLSDLIQTSVVGVLVLLVMLFPTGRAPVGFRALPWIATTGISLNLVVLTVGVGRLENFPAVERPLGLLSGAPLEALEAGAGVLLSIAIVGSFAALGVRFWRAGGTERAQIRFFTAAGFGGVMLIVLAGALAPTAYADQLGTAAWTIAGLALPLATGVAILRHGLYDIDLIVNRALVYVTLTGVLAALYLGLVVLLQRLSAPLTSGSDLAVAASTLAVAGLFRPIRSRIQTFIDRRFYRARYDARATVQAFSGTLRDHVALEGLTSELVGAVRKTLAPAHTSITLIEPSTGTGPVVRNVPETPRA